MERDKGGAALALAAAAVCLLCCVVVGASDYSVPADPRHHTVSFAPSPFPSVPARLSTHGLREAHPVLLPVATFP
jgi:hypothetical protein